MDQDQRQTLRYYLHRYPHVMLPDSDAVLGYLGDLSWQGMMLITYAPLPLHIQQLFCILLPEHKLFASRQLILDAEVRWTRVYQEQDDLYCAGCRFIAPSRENLSLIDAIQTQLGFEPGFNPDRFGCAQQDTNT